MMFQSQIPGNLIILFLTLTIVDQDHSEICSFNFPFDFTS